jgi:hypothetical protein
MTMTPEQREQVATELKRFAGDLISQDAPQHNQG